MSALETALYFSSLHCREGINSPDRACRRCKCAECAVILLQADCAIPIPAKLTALFVQASKRCKLRYIRYMKDRRDRLKQLALDKLPTREIAPLNLVSGRVLDSLAARVTRLLQDHGVRIPDSLLVERERPQWQLLRPTSVYWDVKLPHDADLFFKFGFHDTESWISVDRPEPDDIGTPTPTLEYLHWLATHGALSGQLKSFESAQDIFMVNSIFWRIGRRLNHHSRYWVASPTPQAVGHARSEPPPLGGCTTWVHQVSSAVLPARIADNCPCKCSPGGCTPLTSLLKGAFGWEARAFEHKQRQPRKQRTAGTSSASADTLPSQWSRMAADLSVCLKTLDVDFEVRHHTAALRYATFTALGIPHTCCDPDFPTKRRGWTPEWMAELEDEHAFELDLLNELLEEFEGQVMTILQDPKQGVEGVMHFWEGTWVTRMSEVLDRLESDDLADDEKRAAEEIGVVWDRPIKPPGVDERPENPHDRESPEHWMYELEKIEAEWL